MCLRKECKTFWENYRTSFWRLKIDNLEIDQPVEVEF